MNRQNRMDKYISEFNKKSPIALFFGMKLSFDDKCNAIIDLPYNPNLNHSVGGIHGGVYATLMDVAGWFTAAMVNEIDCWVATAEMSIHFLEPAKRTSLHAVGKLLKSGKRQNIVEMYLYDDNERLVGHATGTFIVLPNLPLLSFVSEDGESDAGRA